MIILDTNVISEPAKLLSDPQVMAWFNRQRLDSLFLTAVNLAELRVGVALLPAGRRKQQLGHLLDETLAEIVTPILPFDSEAAIVYASLVARAKANRYTTPVADGQIAAIATIHRCIVATRDVEPFLAAGVAVVNPWED